MASSRRQDKLANYARITPVITEPRHHPHASRQLENYHHQQHPLDPPSSSSSSSSFSVASRARDAPRPSGFLNDSSRDHFHTVASPIPQRANLRYSLTVFQQPCKARMVGHGDRADRRPVDPPPVLKIEMVDRTQPNQTVDLILQRSPFFMCYSALCQPNPPYEELFSTPHSGKPYMVGSFVSSSVHLREDYDVVPAGHYFLFCDMGVRVEGIYRLKFSVFEIVDHKVVLCASTMSEKFQVFSAKTFPGMERKTQISEILSQQGVRMRQRKKNGTTNDNSTTSPEAEAKTNPTASPKKCKSLAATTTVPTETYLPPTSNSKRKSVEAEIKRKFKRRSTVVKRSLVPLTKLAMSPASQAGPRTPPKPIRIPDIKMDEESITRIIPSIDNMLKGHHAT